VSPSRSALNRPQNLHLAPSKSWRLAHLAAHAGCARRDDPFVTSPSEKLAAGRCSSARTPPTLVGQLRPSAGPGENGRMQAMPALKRYPEEMRERAARLVRDKLADTPGLSVTRACRLVGEQFGINPDTLRNWVKQARIDAGEAPGTTSDDAKRIAELEKQNRELWRANTILRQRARISRRRSSTAC